MSQLRSLRQALALAGLLLFAIGFVLAPTLHRCELAHATGSMPIGCTCTHHPHDKAPDDKPHHAESCSLCKIALTQAQVAPTVMVIPQHKALMISIPPRPEPPGGAASFRLPYSCGPPV